MRAHRPAATLATAAIIATSFAACDDTIAYATPCPDVMHMVVGGVGDPGARTVPTPRGEPRTVIRYSASLAPVGNVSGNQSVREGERKLNQTARAYRAQCPQTRIEVTGASLGALIAGNTRDKWNNDPTMNRNTKFVLISDPRARNGAMNQLPSFIPGFTHTGARPPSRISTSTVCRDNDLICNTGNVLRDPGHAINAAVGYATGAHGYAPRDVDRTPGRHTLPSSRTVVPSTPLPWNPPTARQVLEPIVTRIVPKHLPAPVAREINRLWKQHMR